MSPANAGAFIHHVAGSVISRERKIPWGDAGAFHFLVCVPQVHGLHDRTQDQERLDAASLHIGIRITWMIACAIDLALQALVKQGERPDVRAERLACLVLHDFALEDVADVGGEGHAPELGVVTQEAPDPLRNAHMYRNRIYCLSPLPGDTGMTQKT